MPGIARIAPALGPVIVFLAALANPAGALTLDARAAALARSAAAPPAQGRVAEARSSRDADGELRTHVVLVDDAGRETARFSVPGGVEGRVRWVAEGIPTFVPGQRVRVRLTGAPFGPTVLGEDDVMFEGATGLGDAAAATALTAAPLITSLDPTLGGAVPQDAPVVTVRGARFGAVQLDSRVTFQGLFDRADAAVLAWSDTEVVCRVPAPGVWGTPQILTGPVTLWTSAGGWSAGDSISGGPQFNVLWQWAGDAWPTGRLPIGVWVNPASGPFGDSLAVIAASISSQWNVPGAYARFVYRGLTDAWAGNHMDPATPRDGRNTVLWRTPWKNAPAIIALTWSAIDTLTYDRLEVDLEINGDIPWTVDPEGNPNAFDLPSTLAHEFGHWLRLGHTQRVASVMTAFISPGERRRQISVGDAFGASWIHPSYGVVSVLDSVASGAPVNVTVTAFDRQGSLRTGLPAPEVTVRAIPLPDGVGPLDPPQLLGPGSRQVAANGPTDGNGVTTATIAGLADGLYRIEVIQQSSFVRPCPLVRVGAAPIVTPPALALALGAPHPSPLRPGARGAVHFSLPAVADARLAMYDARGRLVRVLASGRLAAGPHDAPLEATGADGRTLAGGVYFVHLTARDAATGRALAPLTARAVVLP